MNRPPVEKWLKRAIKSGFGGVNATMEPNDLHELCKYTLQLEKDLEEARAVADATKQYFRGLGKTPKIIADALAAYKATNAVATGKDPSS